MAQNRSSAVMQIVTRDEAIALGVRSYFTGEPCTHGHISRRSVLNRDCHGCTSERIKRWARANPEAYKEKERKRYWRNVERKREQMRRYRLEHAEAKRATERARYHKNPEPTKARSRVWWKKSPKNRAAMAYRTQQRRAWVKRATPPWLSAEHRIFIRGLYLDAAGREGCWHVDHIVPLRGKTVCGLNVPWNLQVIEAAANMAKGNRFGSE